MSGRQGAREGRSKATIPSDIHIRNPHLKSLPQEHPLQQGLYQLRDRIDIRQYSTDQQERRAASPGKRIYRTDALGN